MIFAEGECQWERGGGGRESEVARGRGNKKASIVKNKNKRRVLESKASTGSFQVG
jgi:hypothetical protein